MNSVDTQYNMTTQQQFEQAIALCRDIFVKKMYDYGTAWRVLRIPSLTDQIYIKANRIRSLQTKGVSKVGEGIVPEFIAIVNYAIMGLIQLELGVADGTNKDDLHDERMAEAYDKQVEAALQLMLRKNHDYDEAWRLMRVSSYVDFILTKVFRTKQIEEHEGNTLVSEGIDANYLDMLNYAIFAIIKLEVEKSEQNAEK
jgi:hypothetical protein